MTFDETRRSRGAGYFNGRGGIAFGGRVLSKGEEIEALHKIARDHCCVFDDATHRSGYVEVHGLRVRFTVRDDGSLLVTGTAEPELPEYVAKLEAGAEQANKQRTAELARNTEAHKKWER